MGKVWAKSLESLIHRLSILLFNIYASSRVEGALTNSHKSFLDIGITSKILFATFFDIGLYVFSMVDKYLVATSSCSARLSWEIFNMFLHPFIWGPVLFIEER